MKKTRYIPYGYTVRNGITVIDRNEADIIQEIFDTYVNGSSLRDIADMLTTRKVPYTEKTDTWDKARIARIIDNAKYTGDAEFEPIIDGHLYENAVRLKSARKTYDTLAECEAISIIRTHVKCATCQAPMVRHIRNRARIRESWVCSNPQCGRMVRITDGQLLEQITIILNRIIENSELMQPKKRHKCEDSFIITQLQSDIDNELCKETPSEEYIIDRIGSMASQMYKESQAKDMIMAQLAKRRIQMMNPQESFNSQYFQDIVAYITIDEQKRVTVHTKTEADITEGEKTDGSTENT